MRIKPRKVKSKVLGNCFECSGKARVQHECLTCEKLGKSFSVKACRAHAEAALYTVRKHALIAHPVNLLRVTVAALKGE